jgi:hypothetical protein
MGDVVQNMRRQASCAGAPHPVEARTDAWTWITGRGTDSDFREDGHPGRTPEERRPTPSTHIGSRGRSASAPCGKSGR